MEKNTSAPDGAQSVVTFSRRALDEQPDAVKRFLNAYEKGVNALNVRPAEFRSLLMEKGRVPKPVEDSFEMPVFPEASAPTAEQVDDVLRWMAGKGMLERDLSYGELVSDDYLP